jgi:hypothetical protein
VLEVATGVVKYHSLVNLHYTQLIVHASLPLHRFLGIVQSYITQGSVIALLSWWEVFQTLWVLFGPQVWTERRILTWLGIHCWLLWTAMVEVKGDIYREREEVVGHLIRGWRQMWKKTHPTVLHLMWVRENTPYPTIFLLTLAFLLAYEIDCKYQMPKQMLRKKNNIQMVQIQMHKWSYCSN